MAAIKEFLVGCYERFTSGAGFGASRASEDKKIPRCPVALAQAGYLAGMARNQIRRPNRISAPNSENAVCSGWN